MATGINLSGISYASFIRDTIQQYKGTVPEIVEGANKITKQKTSLQHRCSTLAVDPATCLKEKETLLSTDLPMHAEFPKTTAQMEKLVARFQEPTPALPATRSLHLYLQKITKRAEELLPKIREDLETLTTRLLSNKTTIDAELESATGELNNLCGLVLNQGGRTPLAVAKDIVKNAMSYKYIERMERLRAEQIAKLPPSAATEKPTAPSLNVMAEKPTAQSSDSTNKDVTSPLEIEKLLDVLIAAIENSGNSLSREQMVTSLKEIKDLVAPLTMPEKDLNELEAYYAELQRLRSENPFNPTKNLTSSKIESSTKKSIATTTATTEIPKTVPTQSSSASVISIVTVGLEQQLKSKEVPTAVLLSTLNAADAAKKKAS